MYGYIGWNTLSYFRYDELPIFPASGPHRGPNGLRLRVPHVPVRRARPGAAHRPQPGLTRLPSIYFKYDMSALQVKVMQDREPIWQFLVRLCAGVGGLVATSQLACALLKGMIDYYCCLKGSKNGGLRQPVIIESRHSSFPRGKGTAWNLRNQTLWPYSKWRTWLKRTEQIEIHTLHLGTIYAVVRIPSDYVHYIHAQLSPPYTLYKACKIALDSYKRC